jgi:hypothetical protein
LNNLKQILIPSTSGVTRTLAATSINAKDLPECDHLGDINIVLGSVQRPWGQIAVVDKPSSQLQYQEAVFVLWTVMTQYYSIT